MNLQQSGIESTTGYDVTSLVRGSGQSERASSADAETVLPSGGADGVDGGDDGERTGLDSEGVQRMVDEAQAQLDLRGVSLQFRVDLEAGSVQVEVRDTATDKIIRKIPEDELLRLTSNLKDLGSAVVGGLSGALVDKPV